MKEEILTPFSGFPAKRASGNFWCYPKIACFYWSELLGSEQKVLDCILRHTWGFGRSKDRISLSQLESGVRNVHGGVGLSRKQIILALRSLEAKGFITSVKSSRTNEYSLVITQHQPDDTKVNNSSELTKLKTGVESTLIDGVKTSHTKDGIEIKKAIKGIYDWYSQIIHTGTKLTSKASENIEARLVEYWPLELITAMKNAVESDYWEPIVKTNSPTWFFASEERINTFLALGPNEWHPKE